MSSIALFRFPLALCRRADLHATKIILPWIHVHVQDGVLHMNRTDYSGKINKCIASTVHIQVVGII